MPLVDWLNFTYVTRKGQKMKKIYRKIRFWFYSFKEDPKYPCRYDEIVQGAYSRGDQDGMASVSKNMAIEEV